MILGDNKEMNTTLGFVRSFCANHYCRFCNKHRNNMRTEPTSDDRNRRNRDAYDEDVLMENTRITGVREYSVFNDIPFFHVTSSASADLTHDLQEGILHTCMSLAIQYFLDEEFFDLEYLNNQIKWMEFGEAEKGNKPTAILLKDIKKNKFKMSASEMSFFTHHITLLIGNVVPCEDPVWSFVLNVVKFFDLCELPSYGEEDLIQLKTVNEDINWELLNIFEVTLKPKSHFTTHYDELTKEFGPMKKLRTIR